MGHTQRPWGSEWGMASVVPENSQGNLGEKKQNWMPRLLIKL